MAADRDDGEWEHAELVTVEWPESTLSGLMVLGVDPELRVIPDADGSGLRMRVGGVRGRAFSGGLWLGRSSVGAPYGDTLLPFIAEKVRRMVAAAPSPAP